jgi:alkanesulfonate monooxygenase SsuD/methylene tetrahydromethanopterin reductase-like flavin-dependent oxidoreductase (luciferase family)
MDFGIGLLGYHGCWDDAVYAEEKGFACASMLDSQLLAGETFAHMALIADRTTSIRVGSLLNIPSNRLASVTAQGIATINRIAPGRVYLGLGTGYTARNTMNLPPLKAEVMAEYARECRGLLDDEEVLFKEGSRERWIRFVQRPNESINLEDHIPIYLAGEGPKALKAVGEIADGWITGLQASEHMGPSSEALFEQTLATVKENAKAAGRDTFENGGGYTMLTTAVCILEPGEKPTDDRVLERVGAYAMLPFHSATDRPGVLEHLPPYMQERYPIYQREVLEKLPVAEDRRYQLYHSGHLSYMRPGEEKVLTDQIVRACTMTGTKDEVIEKFRALADAGLKHVTMWTPPQTTRATIDDVSKHLIPALG